MTSLQELKALKDQELSAVCAKMVELTAELKARQSVLLSELSDLNVKIRQENIDTKLAAGWRRLKFYANYCGSHPERGYDDINTVGLISPEALPVPSSVTTTATVTDDGKTIKISTSYCRDCEAQDWVSDLDDKGLFFDLD